MRAALVATIDVRLDLYLLGVVEATIDVSGNNVVVETRVRQLHHLG
jgi:hypothetical protein